MNRTHPPLLALAALLLAAPAQADLQACATEIVQYCSGIEDGEGRLTACLASRRDRLTEACWSSLTDAVSNPLVPNSARRMLDPNFSAELPPSCEPAAASLCPEVPTGDGRVFACLYSQSSQVGAECTRAAEETLGAE